MRDIAVALTTANTTREMGTSCYRLYLGRGDVVVDHVSALPLADALICMATVVAAMAAARGGACGHVVLRAGHRPTVTFGAAWHAQQCQRIDGWGAGVSRRGGQFSICHSIKMFVCENRRVRWAQMW
jgi:hypothetical protein